MAISKNTVLLAIGDQATAYLVERNLKRIKNWPL